MNTANLYSLNLAALADQADALADQAHTLAGLLRGEAIVAPCAEREVRRAEGADEVAAVANACGAVA